MLKSKQNKRTSVEDNFKVFKEIKNGQPNSLAAEKYGVPRNTVFTWFLPANKERIMAAISSESINL